MGQVDGKVALVTGAAAGIGKAAAMTLAREGAKLLVTDIDGAGAERVAADIRAAGGVATAMAQDVTDEATWINVIAKAKAEFGALHVLVNNAGVAVMDSVLTMSLDKFRWQNAINIDGVFMGCKHGIPLITASGGGSIINLSSVAGLMGAPMMAGYCASKGAVRLMTKAVAMECAEGQMKVRVNSVHPGIIETEIWAKMVAEGVMPVEGANTEALQATDVATALTPVGYPGTVQNIADGILFLASDASAYMTGSELVIDGGVTAR